MELTTKNKLKCKKKKKTTSKNYPKYLSPWIPNQLISAINRTKNSYTNNRYQ